MGDHCRDSTALMSDDVDLLPHRWSDTDQQIFEYLLQPLGSPEVAECTTSRQSSVNNCPAVAFTHTNTTGPPQISRKQQTDASATTQKKKNSNGNDDSASAEKEKKWRAQLKPDMSVVKKRKATRKRTSPDERKLKHREVQRRFMERKKVCAIDAKRVKSVAAASEWVPCPQHRLYAQESIVRVKKVVAELESQFRLLQLTSEKEALEEENAALQQHLASESTQVHSIEQLKLLLEEEKKVVESHFQPVSPQRWRELLDRIMKEADSQTSDPSFRSMGFSVLGWNDRRKIEGSTVKFTLSKFFPHIWAEELLNKTWEKVTTESYSSFFSPSLYITIHLLQRVSNDAIIVYRAICNPQTNRISRSVELIGRVRRERDFILFIRSFDGACDVHRSVGEPQSWSRSLTILRFEPTSMHQTTPGCTVHSDGAYSNFATAGVKHWLMEVLFLVLRFESSMIAPIFTICAS